MYKMIKFVVVLVIATAWGFCAEEEDVANRERAFNHLVSAYSNSLGAYFSVDQDLATRAVVDNSKELQSAFLIYPDSDSLREILTAIQPGAAAAASSPVTEDQARSAFFGVAGAYHNTINAYNSVVATFSSPAHQVLAVKAVIDNAEHLEYALSVYPDCGALSDLLSQARAGVLRF